MNQDLALTATGTPAIVVGQKRYPLVMTIAGMKEYAEYKESTFEKLMADGWKAEDLSLEDMAFMLKLALRGGEKRRALFNGGLEEEISDSLVGQIVDLSHPTEIIVMLVGVWNHPPEGDQQPDPQSPASPSLGD